MAEQAWAVPTKMKSSAAKKRDTMWRLLLMRSAGRVCTGELAHGPSRSSAARRVPWGKAMEAGQPIGTSNRFLDCFPSGNTPRGFSSGRTSYCPGAGPGSAEDGGTNRLVAIVLVRRNGGEGGGIENVLRKGNSMLEKVYDFSTAMSQLKRRSSRGT